MESVIERFVSGKKIAIAGVSRKGAKFGNMAMKELRQRGYKVYPVNPKAAVVEGETCYADLAALPEKPDGVLVCVPGEPAKDILRQAAAAGVHNVWIQQGAEDEEVLALAIELKLEAVTGKCILMYAPPVTSFHAVHRFIAKLLGMV